ncbi:hypothetical protein [Pseudosulfitobacter pseudonitzschiae]|uniref:hypothetical protein n=1 Tax=Pseudosulfitobacter pseudonitzschiae TaxID=1402135 RepID=UPI003B8044BC
MPTPPIEDLEDQILAILQKNRPGGKGVRGCNNHLDVYDHIFHHELIAPLLKKAHEEGLIGPIDDKGHDTEFKTAWNRVIKGEGHTWDCRSVGDIFVNACIRDVPDVFTKIFSEQYDEIDQAILSNLPRFLTGEVSRPISGWSTSSWVDGSHVYLRLEGLQAYPCGADGGELKDPEFFQPSFNVSAFPKYALDQPAVLQAVMSFHGNGINYDEGQKAWQAWHDAADKAEILKRGYFDSMLGMVTRNILSAHEIGVSFQSLRQDESVSYEITPEGVQIFLGRVDGLETISDEGQLMIAKEKTWVEILTDGGFTDAGARDYLQRLSKTGSSFRAPVPAGSKMRLMLDPETLYAEHMADHDMIYDLPRDQELVICAAGTFDMPEMTSHRQRRAAENVPEEKAAEVAP